MCAPIRFFVRCRPTTDLVTSPQTIAKPVDAIRDIEVVAATLAMAPSLRHASPRGHARRFGCEGPGGFS